MLGFTLLTPPTLGGWNECGIGGRMLREDPIPLTLKQTLKEALSETFHEERELLREVFAEVLERPRSGRGDTRGIGNAARNARGCL
jgi:hypothetical protein